MTKKTWLLILAGVCIAGCIAFTAVGIYTTNSAAIYEGLTSLGEVTFHAQAATPEEDGTYTIYYVSEDGLHNYARYDVGQEEYDSYQFDVAVSMNEEIENPPQSKIKRYVYVYPVDGRYEAVFQDRYMGLTDVSELIDPSPKVASTYYYIVAGILLLAGAYLMFLTLTGKRVPEQASRPSGGR